MNASDAPVSLKRLFLFFIPLGLSVVLINFSHVIINGTLARSDDPKTILAGYALAMSLLAVCERPGVLLRQTCSALVRDRLSFRAVRTVSYAICGASLLFGCIITYTPFGHWIFSVAYGAERPVMSEAVAAWQALMFLTIFSCLRCLYQGVIIHKMQTRWMTIGMLFRISGMFLLSRYFLHTGVTSAVQGAAIFVAGMMIEMSVSWLECRKLVASMPEKDPETAIVRPKHVLPFYNPLLFSSLVVVWALPILNAMLGTTDHAALAIASLTVAGSLMNLMLGFFTYFHQIALHFGKTHPRLVRKFTLLLGFVPTVLLSLMAFTPAGVWMFTHLLGVRGDLLTASLHALQGYLPFVFIFPWLDTLNGFVMSKGETKLMFGSQSANALITTLAVIIFTMALPGWNGVLGSLAQSTGVAAELALLAWLYRRNRKHEKRTLLISQQGVSM